MRKLSDKALLENLINKYGKSKLLNAISKINEDSSNMNYTFSDFWHLLDDYTYYNGQYKHVVGKYAITIKDIFGVDTLVCKSINHDTYPVLAQWIYPTSVSGLEIGVWCGKDGWEHISNIDDLETFFGPENLTVIYNHINN